MVLFGEVMTSKQSKSRDFDHLIEQNSTELPFYPYLINPLILCQAVSKSWRGVISESDGKLELDFGYVKQVDNYTSNLSNQATLSFVDGKLTKRKVQTIGQGILYHFRWRPGLMVKQSSGF